MKAMSTSTIIPTDNLSALTTYKVGVVEATVHRNLRKYCETVLKQYGLSKMHWMMIGTVLEHGQKGIRLTDLAKEVGTTLSYITVNVSLLTLRGILAKSDSSKDSRSVVISIDESYRETCDEIEQHLREALRTAVYSHIDPQDLRIYLKVMFQLSEIDPTAHPIA